MCLRRVELSSPKVKGQLFYLKVEFVVGCDGKKGKRNVRREVVGGKSGLCWRNKAASACVG